MRSSEHLGARGAERLCCEDLRLGRSYGMGGAIPSLASGGGESDRTRVLYRPACLVWSRQQQHISFLQEVYPCSQWTSPQLHQIPSALYCMNSAATPNPQGEGPGTIDCPRCRSCESANQRLCRRDRDGPSLQLLDAPCSSSVAGFETPGHD